MSNVNAPRGFGLRRKADSGPFNSSDTPYKIASGYGTNIFSGDPVKLVAGYIQKAGPGDQIRGILVAVNAVTATNSNPFLAYWPAGLVTKGAQDATALVIDDPNGEFEAQFTNSTTVPTTAALGSFFNSIDLGGNTASGLSGVGVDYSTLSATSNGFVWRLIDYVPRPNNDLTSAYSRAVFVPVKHDMRVTGGAA